MPVFKTDQFKDVHLCLLTHNHADHLDKPGLHAIAVTNRIVAHNNLRPILANREAAYLTWFEEWKLNIGQMEINIRALPVIRATNRLLGMLVGNGNGYLVTFTEGSSIFRVYITGDSVVRTVQHIQTSESFCQSLGKRLL